MDTQFDDAMIGGESPDLRQQTRRHTPPADTPGR